MLVAAPPDVGARTEGHVLLGRDVRKRWERPDGTETDMITGSIERWWPAGTLARGARFEAVFPDDGAEEIWTAAEVRAHLVPHQHARVTRSSKNAHDEEDVRAV